MERQRLQPKHASNQGRRKVVAILIPGVDLEPSVGSQHVYCRRFHRILLTWHHLLVPFMQLSGDGSNTYLGKNQLAMIDTAFIRTVFEARDSVVPE
jgi:hypothetical protein